MAVARAVDDAVSEREQVLAAERDAALATVRRLLAIIAKAGGYMAPEHQEDLRAAKALVAIGSPRSEWRDR